MSVVWLVVPHLIWFLLVSVASEQVEETLHSPWTGSDVRLVQGTESWNGFLQLWTGRRWTWVDGTNWTSLDGLVACRHLGYKVYGIESVTIRPDTARTVLRVETLSVRCQGNETSLKTCDVSKRNVEGGRAYLSCVTPRDLASQCLKRGDVVFGLSCYRLSYERLTQAKASRKCSLASGSLVSIDAQEESDFLFRFLKASTPRVAAAHTAGRKVIFKSWALWMWENSGKVANFTKWANGVPENTKPDECVVLELKRINTESTSVNDTPLDVSHKTSTADTITNNGNDAASTTERNRYSATATTMESTTSRGNDGLPGDNGVGGVSEDEYYFWQPKRCGLHLPYICEYPRAETGCYVGNGESYFGSVNVSASGAACLRWPNAVSYISAHVRDYTHNHCRNPDGDDKPWCYTAPGVHEFCDIPVCSFPESIGMGETTAQNAWCAEGFRCSTWQCVDKERLCDGNKDCSNGFDENICSEIPMLFKKYDRGFLVGASENFNFGNRRHYSRSQRRWQGTLRSCIGKCLINDCVSFVWSRDRYCKGYTSGILNETSYISYNLQNNEEHFYFESPSVRQNCQFECRNKQCVPSGARCDMKHDCVDDSDEEFCSYRENFRVRLADGNSSDEGRVEVLVGGRWSQVLHTNFNFSDALVICKDLGYNKVEAIYVNSKRYPFLQKSSYPAVTELTCSGSEEQLLECDMTYLESVEPAPETVSVKCSSNDVCQTVACFPSPYNRLSEWRDFQRLANQKICLGKKFICDGVSHCTYREDEGSLLCPSPVAPSRIALQSVRNGPGVLLVKIGSGWNIICQEEVLDISLVNMICDKSGELAYSLPFESFSGNLENSSTLDCSGATTWEHCAAVSVADCTKLIVADCLGEDRQVRLRGGNLTWGHVEAFSQGHWKPVCRDKFDDRDAQVFCRMAGFSQGRSADGEFTPDPVSPQFGVLDKFFCDGTEETFQECSHTREKGVCAEYAVVMCTAMNSEATTPA